MKIFIRMKVISLGGVGGCDLAFALRRLNYETYPYDWLITTQTFVMESFNNFDNFFIFDEKYVHNHKNLLHKNKKAVMLHDFNDFTLEKNNVILKYQRRFERLKNTLENTNDDILFVRLFDNLNENLSPLYYYDDIFTRDEENILQWDLFINNLIKLYNKKIKLLVISKDETINNNDCQNTIIYYNKNNISIDDIIKFTLISLNTK